MGILGIIFHNIKNMKKPRNSERWEEQVYSPWMMKIFMMR